MSDHLFPCPSCDFLVFSEPAGSYEIGELCGWEDDHVQLAHPSTGGGANKSSLATPQARTLQIHPASVTVVGEHTRSPKWRPLRPSDMPSHGDPTDRRVYFRLLQNMGRNNIGFMMQRSNPSIERACHGRFCLPRRAAHVTRWTPYYQ